MEEAVALVAAYVGVPLALVEADRAHAQALFTEIELRRDPACASRADKITGIHVCNTTRRERAHTQVCFFACVFVSLRSSRGVIGGAGGGGRRGGVLMLTHGRSRVTVINPRILSDSYTI